MTTILDYSAYVEDRRRVAPVGYDEPKDPLLFAALGRCPFCGADAPKVFEQRESETYAHPYDHAIHRIAWQCSCGWWQTFRQDWRWDDAYEWGADQVRSAILRRYDPSSSELPLATLREALVANPRLIDRVSKKKTEQLVGSVFGDFFKCDVRMVGKSGDGGIDLVLVLADREILVQVKHRDRGSHHWRSEPVATVREFLGATVLSGHRYAILVTTAQRFSKYAEEAAAQAVSMGCLTRYELFDAEALFSTLRLTSSCTEDRWQDNFPSVITADV